MKKQNRGRPQALDDRRKVGLSISNEILSQSKVAALKCSRSLSGFFEMAAKREIKRVNATQENSL